jgi:hypothetical protein
MSANGVVGNRSALVAKGLVMDVSEAPDQGLLGPGAKEGGN